jgi:hypothetical protein
MSVLQSEGKVNVTVHCMSGFFRVEQKTSLFSPVYSILDGGDNLQFTIEASGINSLDYPSLQLFISFYLFFCKRWGGGGEGF